MHTNDRLCINYACITCLLYCASDVNVILRRFRSRDSRSPAMILSHMTVSTLVNVYVDLVVFTRIAGTSKTGSGRYWP